MNEIPMAPYAMDEFNAANDARESSQPDALNEWYAKVQSGELSWDTYADRGLTSCKGVPNTAYGSICYCAAIVWQGHDGQHGTAPAYGYDRGMCWLVQDCYQSWGGGWCFDAEERPGANVCIHSCGRTVTDDPRHDGLDVSGGNKNFEEGQCDDNKGQSRLGDCTPA